MYELVKTIEGKTYNGVSYVKNYYEMVLEMEDGRSRIRRKTITDYAKNGIRARVIDFGTRGSFHGDRQNAEMFLIDGNDKMIGKIRTYAHPENAHGKAVEALLKMASEQ